MRDDQDSTPARYVVGIDLGTTNSAVFHVDTEVEPWTLEPFLVHQLTAPSTIERLDSLPSFHFEPMTADQEGGALALPWESRSECVVGALARDRGAEMPSRLVASAKSWLSHSGVDRTAALLPWRGAPEIKKLSPMEVSRRYLEHIRQSWDATHPEYPLAEQDVVLTVPASFDEIARELTVAAARAGGLPRVVLIEEPQAAFYAWIYRRAETAEAPLEADQNVLVLDVGGGTTDLTLIRVEGKDDGSLRFRRVAVGDHLILGGDNLDLALAHHLEAKLAAAKPVAAKLDRRQWSVLIHRARQAKESLLGRRPPASLTVTLPGGGSKLFGGALSVEVTRAEVRELLIEGFLPQVSLADRPAPRASGFRELGLPYAPDSGITRYLAQFLGSASASTDAARYDATRTDADVAQAAVRPDAVLFNGGFFAGKALRDRVLDVLTSWFGEDNWAPRVLRSERLDLAVAQGAAYFGMVRRGEGERIQGGLAHAYYVGADERSGAEPVEDGLSKALCLVPSGLEEGSEVVLDHRDFELLIREPVEFPIFTSSTRSGDRPGDLIDVDPEQLRALPPIRTVLRSGKKKGAEKVRVKVHARLTEIGTLSVWCSEAEGNRSWRLEFDVRSTVQTDATEHRGAGEAAGIVQEETVVDCERLIVETFGRGGKTAQPDQLMKRLEEAVGQGRWDWPPSLLRALWQALIHNETGRGFSIAHEARWLNLLGFSLRPGFGVAVDDWRMARTWQLFHRKLVHPRNEMCRGEWWVLWRRLSGGLTAGQQHALTQPLMAELKNAPTNKRRQNQHEMAEIQRLLAALEWLAPGIKQELGDRALTVLEAEGPEASSGSRHWALARLGARVPAYGPPNGVVDVEIVEAWLERMMAIPRDRPALAFAVMQLARRTEDRYRDISTEVRERVVEWLDTVGASDHYRELVRVGGELESGEKRLVFGDSLPSGLVIR